MEAEGFYNTLPEHTNPVPVADKRSLRAIIGIYSDGSSREFCHPQQSLSSSSSSGRYLSPSSAVLPNHFQSFPSAFSYASTSTMSLSEFQGLEIARANTVDPLDDLDNYEILPNLTAQQQDRDIAGAGVDRDDQLPFNFEPENMDEFMVGQGYSGGMDHSASSFPSATSSDTLSPEMSIFSRNNFPMLGDYWTPTHNRTPATFVVTSPNGDAISDGAGSIPARKRGRSRKLSDVERSEAAVMRNVGNCASCKSRKCKCDPGIPCKACIMYHKTDLQNNPCREPFPDRICDLLFSGNIKWHPSNKPMEWFCGRDFYPTTWRYTIPIDFGFGQAMLRDVVVVLSSNPSLFEHKHVVYSWPRDQFESIGPRTEPHGFVLPAIFARTDDLEDALDRHLTLLVDYDFHAFPFYHSEFHVLSPIYDLYRHYRHVDKQAASILRSALKFLTLVHIGGDASVDCNDEAIQQIFRHAGVNPITGVVTPCYLRASFGAIVPRLGRTLLHHVIEKIEYISLSRDCNQFALVLATLAIILMGIESIQFHGTKDGYHSNYRNNSAAIFDERAKSTKASMDQGEECANILLRFHKICYKNCHNQLHSFTSRPLNMSREPPAKFVNSIKEAVARSNIYLEQRRSVPVTGLQEMSQFFDRLLAKLFLPE